MIGTIIGVTILVAWIGLIMFLGAYAADESNIIAGIAAAVLFILGVSIVIYYSNQEEQSGPCLKEETSYQYNAGTKTMMPYTYCVDRGKWVNNP